MNNRIINQNIKAPEIYPIMKIPENLWKYMITINKKEIIKSKEMINLNKKIYCFSSKFIKEIELLFGKCIENHKIPRTCFGTLNNNLLFISTMETTNKEQVHFHMLLGELVPPIKQTTKIIINKDDIEIELYNLLNNKLCEKINNTITSFKCNNYLVYSKYKKFNTNDYREYIFKTYKPESPTPCFMSKACSSKILEIRIHEILNQKNSKY